MKTYNDTDTIITALGMLREHLFDCMATTTKTCQTLVVAPLVDLEELVEPCETVADMVQTVEEHTKLSCLEKELLLEAAAWLVEHFKSQAAKSQAIIQQEIQAGRNSVGKLEVSGALWADDIDTAAHALATLRDEYSRLAGL